MDIFENGQKVIEAPEKPETSIKTTNSEPNEDVVQELKMQPYREYFGTRPIEDSKLEDIIEWVNRDGKKSNEEALQDIKRISGKLGSPKMGETELEKVWRQITILKSFITMAEAI